MAGPRGKIEDFGHLMINRALKEVLSYDQKEILRHRLACLEKQEGRNRKDSRRIATRKTAIKDRFKWDESAREFFRSGSYELYAALAGIDFDVVIQQFRSRL